jgi:hypothetical protein
MVEKLEDHSAWDNRPLNLENTVEEMSLGNVSTL